MRQSFRDWSWIEKAVALICVLTITFLAVALLLGVRNGDYTTPVRTLPESPSVP